MRWAIIFFSFALAACSPLRKIAPPAPQPPAPQPMELLAQAEALEKSGNFGGAITLLSSATQQYPDEEGLEQALSRVRNTWEPRHQELQDRLLIIRVESLSKEIPLQEQLFIGDPADRLIKDQIEHSHRQLERSAELLTRCGERQSERSVRLARRCLSLSLGIREDAKARGLLSKLNSKRKTQRAQKGRRQRLQHSEAQQALAASHLQRARELAEETENQAALGEIDTIATTGMAELATASESSEEREKIISQITDKLLMVGDNLYRTGQIEPAIACWQAVLALDPTLEQAGQKMVRAQRVMENLNTLRKQHGVAEPKGSAQ